MTACCRLCAWREPSSNLETEGQFLQDRVCDGVLKRSNVFLLYLPSRRVRKLSMSFIVELSEVSKLPPTFVRRNRDTRQSVWVTGRDRGENHPEYVRLREQTRRRIVGPLSRALAQALLYSA